MYNILFQSTHPQFASLTETVNPSVVYFDPEVQTHRPEWPHWEDSLTLHVSIYFPSVITRPNILDDPFVYYNA